MAKGRSRVRIRTRDKDLWEPTWSEEIDGWTRKFIRTNQWRTQMFLDVDDLMQEAYMVFLKIKKNYPRVIDAPLFMQLYKTALWRHFMDSGRQLKRDILATREAKKQTELFLPAMIDFNEGPLNVALREGPPELRMLVEFINDDAQLAKLREPQRRRISEKPRMNMDQRLSALIGIPYFPFKKVLRKWLFT